MAATMPDPPPVSTIQHYLFESPWLGAIGLGAAGVIILWLGLRDGRRNPVLAGLVAAAVAILWITVAVMVETAGERSASALREFMGFLEAGDTASAQSMVDPQATLQVGGPTAPRLDVQAILDGLDRLGRYSIESISITDLDAYTVGPGEGRADFAAFVKTDFAFGKATASVTFRRDAQGLWEIVNIVWVSLNDEPPPTVRGF